MNKKRIILASTLAVLVAPTVLGNISNDMTTPVQAATTTTDNTIKNPIGTVDYGGAYTVDANGKQTSLFLSGKSSWKLGKSVLINGQRYYEVATNNYISSEHITLTDGMPVVNPTMVKPAVDNQIGTLSYAVKLVDAQGNPTGRTLPAGSSWKLGGMYNIGMNTYYQVGNNEYALESGIKTSIPATSNNQRNTNTSTNTNASGQIGTVTYPAQVVDETGHLSGVTLPVGSSWKLGKVIGIGMNNYYQVATNEYVPVKNIQVKGTSNTVGQSTPVNTTINLYSASYILDDNGNNTGKTLPAGSSWHADQKKTMNHYIYYRVATNQWVTNGGYEGSSNSIFSNGSIAITLNKDITLYDTSTNSLTRTLPKGSSWRVNRSVQNSKGQYFVQVSTNEWLPFNDGSIQDYAGGNTIVSGLKYAAAIEPTFATDVIK